MSAVTFLNGASSLLLLAIPPRTKKEEATAAATLLLKCCLLDVQNGRKVDCFIPEEGEKDLLDLLRNGTAAVEDCRKMEDAANFTTFSGCSPVLCRMPAAPSEEEVDSSDWWTSMSAYLAVRVVLDIFRASSLMLFEVK